jgi:hypothetical protein
MRPNKSRKAAASLCVELQGEVVDAAQHTLTLSFINYSSLQLSCCSSVTLHLNRRASSYAVHPSTSCQAAAFQ